jgi:hypothetical protein
MPDPTNLKTEISKYININKIKENNNILVLILVFSLLIIFIIFVYSNVKKQEYNCFLLEKTVKFNNMQSINDFVDLSNTRLCDFFIKTSYNSCCSGDFKNDYVDYCSLINCAKQGFRALDFEIFSLNGEPVVSESTSTNKNYKEMFNSLPFNEVMLNVRRYFLDDTVNCPNTSDPLFLILRIKSDNIEIYNLINTSLENYFGSGSANSRIYRGSAGKRIDEEAIQNLKSKVIIVLDITNLPKIENSNLYYLSTLRMGTLENQIIRQSDAIENKINQVTFLSSMQNRLYILYPDLKSSSNNYDYELSGLDSYIQFIGMNAQTNDSYLDRYNEFFSDCAFIPRSQYSSRSSIYNW